MWHHVAALVAEWGEDLVGEHGLSSVGAVVGATHPRAVAEARRLMPQSILLLPGRRRAGRHGRRSRARLQSGPASALVTASRSVDLRLPRGGRATSARRRAPRPRGSSSEIWAAPAGSARASDWRRVRRAWRRSCSRPRSRSCCPLGPPGGRLAARATARPPTTPRQDGRDDDRDDDRQHDDDRAGARYWTVQAGDTFGVDLGEDRRPGRDASSGSTRSVVDRALHRREDPAAMRRASSPLLAARPRRARARRAGAGGRRRRSTPAPGVVENARTGEVLASSHAHEQRADRVDHEADDGARRARAPQARPTSSRSTRARPPSASSRSTCGAGEQLTVARPAQGRADPVRERRRRRARALDRARASPRSRR